MANETPKDIRNLALVGHGGCGKTTLGERFLEITKTVGRMGTVEDGNTVCDYEPEEKSHKHSLKPAVIHFNRGSTRFNVIDTPGYPDFIGQAVNVLSAVETVCVVVDGQRGIGNVTRRMMKLAADEGLARAIVINKIDHSVEGLEELVEQLRAAFGTTCLPANLPCKNGTAVINCLDQTTGESDFSSVADAHGALVDQVVEVDDSLMEKYLESGEIGAEDLRRVFDQAMREGHLIPVFFASGRTGAGVEDLLGMIERFCPSPATAKARPFLVKEKADSEEKEWRPTPDPAATFVAHVFRVTSDPFVGKLCVFRVHQGTIKAGDSVSIDDGRKPVRIAHLFELQGKEHEEVHQAGPGEIIAVAKIEELRAESILHNGLKFASIRVRPIPIPRPMFGLAVGAAKRGDEGKISQSLARLCEEDPTFIVVRDAATHEMVIRGIGELHLRVMIEKLRHRFNLEVTTAPPKIAYKETISAKADGHHRHKKQTGGAGQFGEVYLRVEPLPQNHEPGFEFVDDTFGGSVPKQYMPAIEKGVRQVLLTGCVAGYPMSGIRVMVYDGKHHAVDSKEVAFTTAGKRAFMDAVFKAKPVLLEPFVKLEITLPNSYMGDITADLSGRRGRVLGADVQPGDIAIITAIAPLSEVMTYASALKAMTQGAGGYTMEYSHDEPTPAMIQAGIVAAYKPHAEED